MNKYVERLYNGVIKENPTFVLMLGMSNNYGHIFKRSTDLKCNHPGNNGIFPNLDFTVP